jgi:hypothetical protein
MPMELDVTHLEVSMDQARVIFLGSAVRGDNWECPLF